MAQRERKAAIGFILVTVFIDVLGIGIIVPILPELVREFTGGDSTTAARYYGVIAASYAFMQFIFAPLLGALSDRFGRRPVILISLLGLGIDYVIIGLAPNLWWLFAGRLIAGIMGASFTTANAYIADVSEPENRARNFGFIGVAFGLGFIFGPALGGVLGGVHLRLPFFVAAGLALINWLYGYFVLPESLAPENRDRFDLRRANPLGSLSVLRRYPLVAGLAVSFVFMFLAQRGLETVWVLYTGYRFGWDELTNGLTLALVGLMAAIVQGTLVKPVITRLGERRAVLAGVCISIFAFFFYGLASEGWMMLVIIVVGSLGGVAGPALQGLVAGAVSASDQGKVQGGLTSLMSLTAIVSPLVFTAGLFGYFTSGSAVVHLPGAPFFLGSLLLIAALVVVVRLFGRIPPPDVDGLLDSSETEGGATAPAKDPEES